MMRWVMTLAMLSVCLIPCLSVGQEATHNPARPAAPPAPFVLTIQERLLSLQAQDASLQAIIEEIGRRMHIEVKVHLPAEERITLAFEQLSLAEAIEQLRRYTNVVYRTTQAQGDITHIIVFPQGGGTAVGTPTSDTRDATASESRPFRFDFDPSKYLQERK